ncbi:MAG: cytochrome P450 [Dehalococcoidia bacterium]
MTTFNPFVPGYGEDPYPALARLRAAEPVHFSEDLGAWVLTRYADCVTVLRDSATFRSDFLSQEGERWDEARRRSQLFLDGIPALSAMAEPDHHRMRETVQGAFSPRAVQRLRPRIQAAVDALLARARPGEPFEVMGGLAYPLPRLVIEEQLGIADVDREPFMRAASLIASGVFGSGDMSETVPALEAREALHEYLARLDAEPPDADGALARMRAAHGAGTLSDAETVGLMVDVALAGNDPTACLIGNGLLALLRHPEVLDALRADPSLIPGAVEEFLRFDSPLHALMRIAARDVEVGGVPLRAGDVVYLMLGAANRDPAQFEEPDRLDIRRPHLHHLGFGGGAHHCLGAPLARLEAEVVFTSLLARFPGLRLAPLGVERQAEFELRAPARLRVLID